MATPMKLIRVDGELGYLEHDGKEYEVNLSLIDDPKAGDWILAHAELAVSKISSQEAENILKLIAKSGHSCSIGR